MEHHRRCPTPGLAENFLWVTLSWARSERQGQAVWKEADSHGRGALHDAECLFYMLSRNAVSRALGANYCDERRRQVTVDRPTRRIEQVGYRVYLEPVIAPAV